jgi:O-antigen/teichoic acid export membrane protein
MAADRSEPELASGARAAAGRAGWGFVDQAVSSLSNFVLFLLIARSVPPAQLGAVTLAYSAYVLSLGASRAIATEPLVVRHSAATRQEQAEAIRASAGTALALGLVVAGPLAAGGALLGGQVGTALLAVALVLPGLLVQDAWRFAFFATGRPARAVLNDGVWAVLQLGAVAALLATGEATVFALLLAWGLAGCVAGALGYLQTRLLPDPRPRRVLGWLRDQRDLGLPFFGDYAVSTGTNEAVAFTMVAAAGLEVLGAYKAAHVLMGPVSIMLMGAVNASVPEGVRLLRTRPDRLWRTSLGLGTVLAAGTAAWGAVVLLLPDPLGSAILGESWAVGREAFPPLLLAFGVLAFANGAGVGLRVRGLAAVGFRIRLVVGPLGVATKTAGAVVAGAPGAAAGAAVEHVIGAVLGWRAWSRHDRRALATPVDDGGTSGPGTPTAGPAEAPGPPGPYREPGAT